MDDTITVMEETVTFYIIYSVQREQKKVLFPDHRTGDLELRGVFGYLSSEKKQIVVGKELNLILILTMTRSRIFEINLTIDKRGY